MRAKGGDRTKQPNPGCCLALSRFEPVYLAQEQGYFNRAGLQVEVQRVANSNQAIPLLAGGRVDVALFSISPAQVNAVARGGALRIVAAREIASPGCGSLALCGRRAVFPRGASDLKRIKRKRVAIYGRGNTAEFALETILSTVGLEPASVQVVSLPSSEAVSALVSGKVDAVLTDAFGTGRVSASAEVVTLTGSAVFALTSSSPSCCSAAGCWRGISESGPGSYRLT